MDEKLIGIVTSNNITITGKSNHSIARVIGSIEQRRIGVGISDILDNLTNPDDIKMIKCAKKWSESKICIKSEVYCFNKS
ncbi:MAG: hypothetical protein KHZ87_06325 [Clostridiales bacterium]|nr:hypothetical protein [Clostridiales bacterium]MBS5877677.1 hypothetical protein [Clostridiales bacterium]MDU0940114.1 hypothetical protein [Clostridiales bacterium]MDU1042507.1 hypothetical protein [Clostridiales bacterium]MDU3490886.1 hypothetical protein [Clostridiales bacterium]